jgi:hypothetical protein
LTRSKTKISPPNICIFPNYFILQYLSKVATSTITYGSATLTSVSADLTTVLAAGDAVQLVGGGGDVRNYTVASVPSSSTVTLTEIIGMETATTVPLRHNRQSIKVREVVVYLDTCECVFVFLCF